MTYLIFKCILKQIAKFINNYNSFAFLGQKSANIMETRVLNILVDIEE